MTENGLKITRSSEVAGYIYFFSLYSLLINNLIYLLNNIKLFDINLIDLTIYYCIQHTL